jgi:methionine sulfoxide reductase heme-binding subunit
VAGRLVRNRNVGVFHQQLAVCAIFMIGLHGVTLLGDPWLDPGPAGITVPFSLSYRPLWTGLGIIGGYLAVVLGLSFYIRGRIGRRLWRRVHGLIIVVYVLAVAHTLGAGTDASTVWLRCWIALTAPVILVLFLIRVRPSVRRPRPARTLSH